jgi:hypothetical protein
MPALLRAVMTLAVIFASPALAYRPYDSTDADVADSGETEIEFGWRFSHRRQPPEHAGQWVLNVGLGASREIVLEGEWARSTIVDAAVLLKQVHRRGALQGEPGLSIASECGVLIPTAGTESGAGGECLLIASHGNSVLSWHVNAGIEFDTEHRWAHSVGVILEGPHTWRLRPGVEVRREAAESEEPEVSALAGVVWSARESMSFDLAYRRSLAPSSEQGEWRLGVTWSH